MKTYQNYHRHSMYTNTRISDSTVGNEDYAKRAVELNHGVISSIEHGYQGRYIETYKLAKKYNLKAIIGAECYWVKDRLESDRTNSHICIIAKNENGRRALNNALSEANITGYYFQPRLDIPLILSLPKDDVWVTTACIAYWKYDDIDEITELFAKHFGENFFLEVQYHNTDSQREVNRHILELKNRLNLQIIMGCDSHYLFEEQHQTRTDFLASKGINYPEEEGWYLDYPDGDTVYKRFATQCVLSNKEINEAMSNTHVFLEVEEYDSPIFNDDIKMPSLYPEWTQEQKDNEYKRLVLLGWENYKDKVPKDRWEHYENEIQKEMQVVIDTKMSDYFINNYHIIKKGRENGGWLTKSGRGCFTKDALVPTLSELKHINEIVIGDFVFDIDGKPQEVLDTFEYDVSEPLIKITHAYGTDKYDPMICTLDHKILIHRNNNNEWIEAKNIQDGDYVCCPKIQLNNLASDFIDLNKYNVFGYKYDENYIYEYNSYRNKTYAFNPSDVAKNICCGKSTIEKLANRQIGITKRNKHIVENLLKYTGFNSVEEYSQYVEDIRTTKINRYIPNDETTNIFIGMLYGDGFCSFEKQNVGLAINTGNFKNAFNRSIFQKMAKRFGIQIYENKSKNKQLTQLYMKSNCVASYVKTELFISKKGKEKQFNSRLLFQSEKNRKAIVKGMLVTDGSVRENTRNSFDNTSLSIINAFKVLGMSYGEQVYSLMKRKAYTTTDGYNCKRSYKLREYSNSSTAFKSNIRTISDDRYIYLPVIKTELLPITKTKVYDICVANSHSYLLNNAVVHNSAVSFFTNMLLGFTEVDRIAAKVHMYPERFMSKTRILESGSLPDIDFNCAPVEPFAKAQKEVLGEEHSYPMIAYGTMQNSSSWKLYAKSQGIVFEIANAISMQIQKYENAVKHADEDDKDTIDVLDYIDKEYHDIYDKSKDYLGLITSWSIAPCSYLIYTGNIREEIGLIKIKDNLCCLMDGHWAEDGHFLKNDLLKVSVVDLIYRGYKRIGLEPPTVSELIEMCDSEDEVWSVYGKGCTLGINQVEQIGTASRVAKYKPTNISELSAFVAAIRPGFKSMYKAFESRKPFSYGVKAFDDLIKTEEMPDSFLLYQEQEMSALNYAGINMSDCYTAIKNIAKKRADKVLSYKGKFIEGFAEAIKNEGKDDATSIGMSEQLWQIIEDSANYSFNASHSYCVALDSLYSAWLKAHHPLKFYEVLLTLTDAKSDKDKMATIKQEAEDYYGIVFPPYRYGQDNRTITADEETNTITNSLSAIKGFGNAVGETLYECSKQNNETFIDVLHWLDERAIKSSKVKPLILIDFFQSYGNARYLSAILEMWELFAEGKAKSVKKDKVENEIMATILSSKCLTRNKDGKESVSYRFDEYDAIQCLKEYEQITKSLDISDFPIEEKMEHYISILGYVDLKTNKEEDRRRLLIESVFPLSDAKGNVWGYRVCTKSIGTGKAARVTVKPVVYKSNPIQEGDIIYVNDLWKNSGGYWYLISYDIEKRSIEL